MRLFGSHQANLKFALPMLTVALLLGMQLETHAQTKDRSRNKGLEKLFNRLDSNDDGRLTSNEIPERLKVRVGKMDPNSDGVITRIELVTVMRKRARSRIEKSRSKQNKKTRQSVTRKRGDKKISEPVTADQLLRRFDKDRDSSISEQEAPKKYNRMFSATDANDDGKLDKTELTSLIERIKARDQSKKRYDSSSELSKGQLPKRPPRSDD